MAQVFAEKYGFRVRSTGTVSSSRANRVVVEAMGEKGIEYFKDRLKMLDLA